MIKKIYLILTITTILILATIVPTIPIFAVHSSETVYTIDRGSNTLRIINHQDATTISSIPITGSTGNGATALTADPNTGELFAILKAGSGHPGPRVLATIDPNTGIATIIGTVSKGFAELAIDSSGTLFAVSGNGASPPETLFTLDRSTAAATLVCALGNGNDGETIAYNRNDGQLYHGSGIGTNRIFEVITSTAPSVTCSTTNIPLSGDSYSEQNGLAYLPSENVFLTTSISRELLTISPTGVTTLVGSLRNTPNGIAVVPPSSDVPPSSADDDIIDLLNILIDEVKEIWDAIIGIEETVSNIEEVVTAPTVASFIDTETIDLDGHLSAGDFKLLMDITPFKSVTGHVAMKVPCDKQGDTDLAILTGVAPTVTPLTMNFVEPLSDPGKSCVYHGNIGAGDTDIALINTGKKPVNFGPNDEGFSVTITIQGTK